MDNGKTPKVSSRLLGALKACLSRLYKKLGTASRTQLVILMAEQRLSADEAA
jgi:hypothetical protein